VHQQISEEVSALVATGALAIGSSLPTVRQLARDLGVSPGTVARSYRDLEAAGTILTDGRRGSKVASKPAVGTNAIDSTTTDLVRQAKISGVPLPHLLALITEAYDTEGATTG
jgi:DNA-binding transcriptional regulator YhcF (GntR family)